MVDEAMEMVKPLLERFKASKIDRSLVLMLEERNYNFMLRIRYLKIAPIKGFMRF